jgi:mycothiol synthase
MSSSQSNMSRLLSDDRKYGRITAIRAGRLDEAIGRLLMMDGHVEPSQVKKFREYAETNRIGLEHVWGRVDEAGRVSQTVLAITNPGRTAMVFASHPVSGREITALGGLIDHACTSLAEADTRLAQALLQPEETLEAHSFIAGGFSELARLSYLERAVPKRDDIPQPSWPDRVTVEPYDESSRDEFLIALERTYKRTLDCPELRGMRETHDILDGHRGAGVFDPSLWTLLRMNREPMGLILLNPSPAQKSIELVYFGLAPAARGMGLGRELLRHGLNLVAGRDEKTINLAVDERNVPALKLYGRKGFSRTLCRIALIRPLCSAST